jgi:hypothetical protein
MKCASEVHDHAFTGAMALMNCLPPTLEPCEREAFFHKAYTAVLAIMESYSVSISRTERPNPSAN